jgi:hypothetical protein
VFKIAAASTPVLPALSSGAAASSAACNPLQPGQTRALSWMLTVGYGLWMLRLLPFMPVRLMSYMLTISAWAFVGWVAHATTLSASCS